MKAVVTHRARWSKGRTSPSVQYVISLSHSVPFNMSTFSFVRSLFLPSFPTAFPVVFVSLKTWLVSAPANLSANAWLDLQKKKDRGSPPLSGRAAEKDGIQTHWTAPSITVAELRIIIGRTNWGYRAYGGAFCLFKSLLWWSTSGKLVPLGPFTKAQIRRRNRLDTVIFFMLLDFGFVIKCRML